MSLNIELDVSVLAAKGQPNPTRLQSTVLECGKRCGKAVLPQLLPQQFATTVAKKCHRWDNRWNTVFSWSFETPAKTIVLVSNDRNLWVVAKLLCHTLCHPPKQWFLQVFQR